MASSRLNTPKMDSEAKCPPDMSDETGIRGLGVCTKSVKEIENLGRTLVKILRHEHAKHGLVMGADGYVKLGDILRLPNVSATKTRSKLYLGQHTEVC